MMRSFQRTVSAWLGLIAIAGCSKQTIDSAKQDTRNHIVATKQVASEATEGTRSDLRRAGASVKRTEVKAVTAADREAAYTRTVARDVGVAERLRAALSVNGRLNGSHVHVHAVGNTVELKGTARTPEQRDLAQRVAEDTVPPGLKVVNHLIVAAP